MIDWTFHIGSCAMRAFPFYLWSFQIFNTMEQRPSDFMIWTGDHVYMLKPWQWKSKEAMIDAYNTQRESAPLKKYMASRPQYAIWDDHDFGPNNAGAEFFNKDTALEVFKEMWPNQIYANKLGIYHTFSHHEAQFFMMDGRYFKIPDTQLLGKQQLDWLCNELKNSKATFKFVCLGIQALCDGGYENFRKYPSEFAYFMKFISENKIEGVIFMTGDMHYAEVTKVDRIGEYPLFDFTISPLTSFPINYFTENKYRVEDTKLNQYNFGEVTFSGVEGNRSCHVKCINKKGQELWAFKLNENELKYKK
jgi:alkaline phosphatase D